MTVFHVLSQIRIALVLHFTEGAQVFLDGLQFDVTAVVLVNDEIAGVRIGDGVCVDEIAGDWLGAVHFQRVVVEGIVIEVVVLVEGVIGLDLDRDLDGLGEALQEVGGPLQLHVHLVQVVHDD